jgi:outer membrane protein assembly factor BamB
VTNATKFVRGYEPLTGKELWRIPGGSEIAVPTPFQAHGLAFVFAGYGPGRPMYAIKPGGSGDIAPPDGKTDSAFVAWSNPRGAPYLPTPIVVGNELYVVQNNGVLAAYDAKTGERRYQERLKGSTFTARRCQRAAGSTSRTRTASCSSSRQARRSRCWRPNPIGEAILATPAIADGVLYVRGQQHLFAVGEKK